MHKADILIVDDTPTNISLLTQMLANQGYSVRAATNGQRALESVNALPPDLIMLDIRMPGLNGFEVCERLKAEENTRDIPVIFISALDDVEDKVRGFKVGGIDYITKPFQLEEVLVRTENHLAMRSLQHQLLEKNRKMTQELALAAQMQTHLMPKRAPDLPGWHMASRLMPAFETSGDYFDIFMLPDGRVGLLIADVVDKGVAAALFMAYSWSLLRTYSDEYYQEPEKVFVHVNRRILADTATGQFVTVFLGMLHPSTGMLEYCNAGHLPPLICSAGSNGHPLRLLRTGIPLGILEDQSWGTNEVKLNPGDLLLLYTDGVIDAINESTDNFGEQRLHESLWSRFGQPASLLLDGLSEDIKAFTGESRQFDDIAMVVVNRQ